MCENSYVKCSDPHLLQYTRNVTEHTRHLRIPSCRRPHGGRSWLRDFLVKPRNTQKVEPLTFPIAQGTAVVWTFSDSGATWCRIGSWCSGVCMFGQSSAESLDIFSRPSKDVLNPMLIPKPWTPKPETPNLWTLAHPWPGAKRLSKNTDRDIPYKPPYNEAQ